MLQGKRTRRMVAATLLTILLTDTFAPTISFALTSGPTQPEATSFEPIDTTDMVNLQTGNFTYNIPLLEVPGPEGGYPLSLSYHAGIQTNEDASWVGLGWTLNTGAISRNVNGYPDDWTSTSNTSRVFWSGGKTTTYTAGVSIGLDNLPMSVNAGLSFSSDTYQGFGVGLNFGVGVSSGPLNASVGLGVSPQGGGKSINAGVGLGTGLLGVGHGSLRLSVSSNFESLQVGFRSSVGIGFDGVSLLGASIGTNDSKPSISVGGLVASVSGTTPAGVSTQSTTWGISLPTPVPGLFVSLGYSKERYWTDETTSVTTQGSLYTSNPGNGIAGQGYIIPDGIAFDSYSLLVDPLEQNFLDNPDPTLQQGGAFPAFDDYEVSAQGLGGSMRPYQFQGQVFGQNRGPVSPTQCEQFTTYDCNNHYVEYYNPNQAKDPMPQFRFVNDFSNTYQQTYPSYSPGQLTSNAVSGALFAQPLPFGPSVTGNSSDPTGTGVTGFSNNQLAGSKHVEIGIDVKPYNFTPSGYTQTRLAAGMIEGFTITNESGVKYTFGLPAYSYNEEAYQEKVDHSQGYSLTRQKKLSPYAYTWYLTSITGPDFVDRNGDGMADDGDWGYWVDFEYGKWSDNYYWRNPSEGYNTDEDNEWQNSSLGEKEVYYLNAVRTRSHVALFEKDVRADARGESTLIPTEGNTSNSDPNYTYPGLFDNSSATSLQLSHIYLLNSADEGYVTPTSGTLNPNVLDATDVNTVGRANLESKAIRVIDFRYDNSLCPGTSNSFTTPGTLLGKLTLLSVGTRGKGGANLLPPSTFQYDLGNSAVTQAGCTLLGKPLATGPSSFSTTNGNFNVGDMVMNTTTNSYLGVISAKTPSGSNWVYALINSFYTWPASTATITTTKNPPYFKDAYDAWGMYKSDINTSTLTTDVNSARVTSSVSAPGTDAWSLRTITTELGSQLNIQYEPDNYFNSTADPLLQSLTIDQITVNATAGTMLLSIDKGGNPAIRLADTYSADPNSPNNKLNAVLLQEYQFPSGVPPQTQDGTTSYGCFVTDTRTGTVTFSDSYDNTLPTGGGFGLGLNYYPGYALVGSLTVQSIDDVNNTITVGCTDNFLLGKSPKTITDYLLNGGTPAPFNATAWMSNSYGGNLFINSTVPLYGGGIRVKSLSETEQMPGPAPGTASVPGVTRTTSYTYTDNNGNCSGVSSYTPALAVSCFDFPSQFTYQFYQGINLSVAAEKSLYYKSFRRIYENNASLLFSIARELPAPGVMYSDVSVSWQVQNPDEPVPRNKDGASRTEYQFEVIKGNMVGRIVPVLNPTQTGRTVTPAPLYDQSARYYAMDKFISCIGNTKSIIQYDDKGNKLTETDNHYLHDNLINTDLMVQTFMTDYKNLLAQYNYQGYIQERFGEAKMVSQQNTSPTNGVNIQGVKLTITGREEYPCIYTGQTVINYVNGTQTTSKNLAYDFYSGAVTETLETDAYGNNIRTETVPAYKQNLAMGLKVTNPNNLNMLTQAGETRVWKVDGSNNTVGLVSASVNTWTNQFAALDIDGSSHIQDGRMEGLFPNGNVWRMQNTYNWMVPNTPVSGGLTPSANYVPYKYTAGAVQDSRWVQTGAITTYDVFSKALEGTDINGIYSATRMNYGESKVILTGSPANYYEIAFSGAEDAGLSQTGAAFVKAADGVVSSGTGVAHTGAQSLLLGVSGKKGFLYSVPVVASGAGGVVAGRTYTASVWVKPVGGTASNVNLYYSVNGTIKNTPASSAASSASSTKIAGGWTLINMTVNGSDLTAGSTLNVWCENDHATATAYVDDMRFQPLNASTTAYVYDPFSGDLTDILDNNNLYTRFEYDAAGRLIHIYKEKLNSAQFTGGEFKTKQYQYNYSAPQFASAPVNESLSKNNCPLSGQVGSLVPVSFPNGAYTSFFSPGDANAIAAVYAQDYANTHGTCFCEPTFTYAANITGPIGEVSSSGGIGSFEFNFTWPTPFVVGETINLGNFTGGCAVPSTTMTVPVYVSATGATYNVLISPQGNVQVTLMTGTPPTTSATIVGQYGLTTALAYSPQEMGTFTKTCQAGFTAPPVTYVCPPYRYAAANSTLATQLALNDVAANGPANANNATCTPAPVTCTFNWSSNVTEDSELFTELSSTVTFSLFFRFNGPGFSGGAPGTTAGAVGTVTGSCVPSATRTFSVNDPSSSGRSWTVTVTTSGAVSVSLRTGSPEDPNSPTPIKLSGTYAL
jgi:Family of unknown function (DUF5977)